jgi:hypothetical protein
MDIHRKSIVPRSIGDILQNYTLCQSWDVGFKRFYAVYAKTPLSCENRIACLQMHLKYKGYTDTVLFSTIGKAGDVLVSRISIAN